MIPRIDTRMYTNIVLTVIAMMLMALAFQTFKINVVQNAQAQIQTPPINTSIPQTQDVAVAAATTQVAAANQEIAKALIEVARAIDSAGSSIARSGANHGSASATPAASTSSSSRGTERPTVEVNP